MITPLIAFIAAMFIAPGGTPMAPPVVIHSGLAGRGQRSNDPEVVALDKMGKAAFKPALELFIKTCAKYDAGREGADYQNEGRLYSKYHDLSVLLGSITTPQNTPELLQALLTTGTSQYASAKSTLLGLLAKVSEPALVTPYFLKEMEDAKAAKYAPFESSTYALEYVENSNDPRAVAFLIKALKDLKANVVLREAAYFNLARTGGAAGLESVLAERHTKQMLAQFEQRVIEDSKVVSKKTDKNGITWGLITSGELGNYGDLFFAEQVDGHWINPLFTGVSEKPISRWVKNPPPEPRIGGKTGAQLVKADWLNILADNQEIQRRTVKGVLTDLERQRLGLQLSSNDANGNGVPDDIDPWPNVAPCPLDESEQVMAAVFEARFHFEDRNGPALLFASGGMKPFQMVGRNGPTIWVPIGTPNFSLPLGRCYEYGVAFIRFGGDSDLGIQWNASKTEAKLAISNYYGGLNGNGYDAVVRKFGNDWVVVSMRMAYIS